MIESLLVYILTKLGITDIILHTVTYSLPTPQSKTYISMKF